MNISVEAVFDEATCTATYLVWDKDSRATAIIDPVLDYDLVSGRTDRSSVNRVMAVVDRRGLDVSYILETHIHADHLSGAQLLKEATGARVHIGQRICEVQANFAALFGLEDAVSGTGAEFDRLLAEGETLGLGDSRITVLETPGHTPACLSYIIDDHIFVGDTIFMPDFGTARCDFPGGDARTLYHSIQKILSLPGETRVFVGHDYAPGGRAFAWETTVARERDKNIHVGGAASESDFVRMRTSRDAELKLPRLIVPAVQVNIRAGHLPPADGDGRRYVKVPLNSF